MVTPTFVYVVTLHHHTRTVPKPRLVSVLVHQHVKIVVSQSVAHVVQKFKLRMLPTPIIKHSISLLTLTSVMYFDQINSQEIEKRKITGYAGPANQTM
jgi:hypothetical protein